MANVSSCPYFPRCSGCSLIGVDYPTQLQGKLRAVRVLFEQSPLHTFEAAGITKITASPRVLGYRNRARLVPSKIGNRINLGLYRAGSHSVVDIPGCPVQSDGINAAVEIIRAALEQFDVILYDEHTHEGDLRFVTVREGTSTGEILIGLVTRTEAFQPGAAMARYLLERCPSAVGVVQNINPQKGNIILGPVTRVMAGRDYVEEIACGIRIPLNVTSFFQANTLVAEKAYEAIVEGAISSSFSQRRAASSTVLLDLYCGVGTIGLICAKHVDRVIGVEEFPDAVALAQTAAKINEERNIGFLAGLVEDLLPSLASELHERHRDDDLVVAVNPPRRGLDPTVLESLVGLHPSRIAYLSCVPRTLLRDLIAFERGGYRVAQIELFDMFPQTDQVETLAILEDARTAGPRG